MLLEPQTGLVSDRMSALNTRNSQVTHVTQVSHRLTSSNMNMGPISRHYPDNLIDRLPILAVSIWNYVHAATT